MAFPAKFPGQCVVCKGRFRAGDPIDGRPRAWLHVTCVSLELPDDEPELDDDDGYVRCVYCRLIMCDFDERPVVRTGWGGWGHAACNEQWLDWRQANPRDDRDPADFPIDDWAWVGRE